MEGSLRDSSQKRKKKETKARSSISSGRGDEKARLQASEERGTAPPGPDQIRSDRVSRSGAKPAVEARRSGGEESGFKRQLRGVRVRGWGP